MSEHAPEPGPKDDRDPGASTEMFQAFVDRYQPEDAAAPRSRATLIGVALVALVIVVVLAWLVLRG